mmetsp:Transcript_14466/g.33261  ORF Transcript_14466/g.33261 Transcript_14466/m.33261 type:complete len:217 (+) Transcript_14466:158-808(+)
MDLWLFMRLSTKGFEIAQSWGSAPAGWHLSARPTAVREVWISTHLQAASTQELLDVGLDGRGLGPRAVSLSNLPVPVDEELGEVPADVLRPCLWARSQVLEHRVGVRSVHVHLGKHWESHAVLCCHEVLDGRLVIGFLTPELVARESQYSEAAVLVFLVQVLHATILAGTSSVGRSVHDEPDLPSELVQRHVGAVDVLCGVLPERVKHDVVLRRLR